TAPDWKGPLQNPEGRREYLLDVSAGILGGRLRMGWSYSLNQYRPSTIERIAARFRESLAKLLRLAQPTRTAMVSAAALVEQSEYDAVLSEVSFEGSHD
ncbi:MAG TPA: hypothetical protein VNQ74_16510, partial [Burkholderiaceae bacterium]|nr:hypothetical protein [Burkholderiaceae bacterium]